MATHDYVIDNSTGANVRADINNVLQAILTNNSSSSAPSTTAAYMWWADTANGVLKIRNSANNDWVELLQLDGTLTMETGTTASAPSLAFRGDLDTGIFQDAANHFQIATAGVERVEFQTTEVVFNDGGNDIDFRIEGDSQANLFKLDAGDDRIGVAISAPRARFDLGNIVTDTTTLTRVADRYQILCEATDSSSRFSNNIGFILSGGTTVVACINAVEEGGNGSTGLSFATSSNSSSDPVEVIRITSDGKVNFGSVARVEADGVFKAPHGSASTPAYNFLNDNDNGMFRATTNTIGFSTGGLERMRITGSGHVGIGTTTPDLLGATTDSTYLAVIETSGTRRGKLLLGDNQNADTGGIGDIHFVGHYQNSGHEEMATIKAAASGSTSGQRGADIVFETKANGTAGVLERMRVDSTGLIGIGKTPASAVGSVLQTKGNDGVSLQRSDESNSTIIRPLTSGLGLRINYQGGQEHFRLMNSGQANVLSTDNGVLDLSTTQDSSSNVLMQCVRSRTAMATGGVAVFRIFVDGSFGTVSDEREKKNIVTTTKNYLEDISKLRVVNFNWLDQDDSTTKELGLIAQEVETIFPTLIQESAVDEVSDSRKAVKTSLLPIILIKSMQELLTKVETLETKVATLEAA